MTEVPLHRDTVLVVDDQPESLRMLTDTLESNGISVLVAVSGQAALDLAKTITADGHTDFAVPTRFESALLYANLQDQFDTDYWHWTSTQYSESHAWSQVFYYGHQGNYSKDYERRCRFVRRFKLVYVRPAGAGISGLPPAQAQQLKLPGF